MYYSFSCLILQKPLTFGVLSRRLAQRSRCFQVETLIPDLDKSGSDFFTQDGVLIAATNIMNFHNHI